jgi:uncharacterized protein (DUF1697 family)
VGLGNRRIANRRLAELVEGLGYTDAWTYISSGNVVFDAPGRRADIERQIEQAVEADVGFEATTFVRSAAELARLRDRAPFGEVAAPQTYFVTFLKAAPTAEAARRLEALSNDFDTLVVEGRDVHWLMQGKSTDTLLTKKRWEGVVGVDRSTSRNTTMLYKLVAKLEAG